MALALPLCTLNLQLTVYSVCACWRTELGHMTQLGNLVSVSTLYIVDIQVLMVLCCVAAARVHQRGGEAVDVRRSFGGSALWRLGLLSGC